MSASVSTFHKHFELSYPVFTHSFILGKCSVCSTTHCIYFQISLFLKYQKTFVVWCTYSIFPLSPSLLSFFRFCPKSFWKTKAFTRFLSVLLLQPNLFPFKFWAAEKLLLAGEYMLCDIHTYSISASGEFSTKLSVRRKDNPGYSAVKMAIRSHQPTSFIVLEKSII